MKTHYLNLQDSPYKAIKEAKKTIEMRLYDEKRSIIEVGDIIIFDNKNTSETLKCEVVELLRYKDFVELYSHHSNEELGYENGVKPNPNDMSQYYSKDKIDKYGVLGIRIRLI